MAESSITTSAKALGSTASSSILPSLLGSA